MCLACIRRARERSDFCSDICERAFAHQEERAPQCESVECQRDYGSQLWIAGQRLNLQNSA